VRPFLAGTMISCVTLISAASIVVQHRLLGVNYPSDRAALYFIPLLGLLLVCSLAWLRHSSIRPVRLLAGGALVVLASASSLHALGVTDPRHPLFWRSDWDTKEMMQDLVAERARLGAAGTALTAGGNWLFEPTVNFYRLTWRLDWLRVYRRELPYARGDYYFLLRDDHRVQTENALVAIRQYQLTDNILARPQGPSSPRAATNATSPP
jgi:hypothetical protein